MTNNNNDKQSKAELNKRKKEWGPWWYVGSTTKWVFLTIGKAFKKSPLTSTLIVLTLLSLPYYLTLYSQYQLIMNGTAAYRLMSLFTLIIILIVSVGIQGGIYFLIIKAVQSKRASKNVEQEDGATRLRKVLINSRHLQNYYAPLNMFTNPSTGEPFTQERIDTVNSHIVELRHKTEKKVEQYEVRFRITSDPKGFQTVLMNTAQEIAVDEIKLDLSYRAGGYYQVVVVPSLADNPLGKQRLSAKDFYSNLPMKDRPFASIPVGLNEDGEVVWLPLTHTFGAGESGSGKGSMVQCLFQYYCTAPVGELSFVDQKLVEFYLIDPKNAEFPAYRHATFATTVTNEETGEEYKVADDRPETHAYTIHALHERMNNRSRRLGGRSFNLSKQTPLLILEIDEILNFYDTASKETKNELRAILVKGRSLGVFVFGFGQEVVKERLPHRDNFLNKIALKLAKQSDATTLFGISAELLLAAKVQPEMIPKANDQNDYATAGQAFLFNGITNQYELMRFFYTSDEDIESIRQTHTPEEFLNIPTEEIGEDEVL